MKQIIITIYGKVQGVFFRWETKNKADELNLSGYVENETDGSVKIVAEGKGKNLKELVKWCYNGASGAVVEKVGVEWGEASGEFKEFDIKI